MIHSSHIDCIVEVDEDLPVRLPSVASPTEKTIGQLIAHNLVEDGATLQMGN